MFSFLIASALAVEAPDWTRGNTLERSGTALRVVCVGHGPSLDLAREQAANACRSEAIRQAQASFTVRSESIESEKNVAFHQQITSEYKYTGVSCQPLNEAIDSGPDSTTVYLKCLYNLSKIKSIEVPESAPATKFVAVGQKISQEVPEVDAETSVGYKKDAMRHILLSTVPDSCDTVIVRGPAVAKVIPCTGNPQILTLDSRTTKGLLIRPRAAGYMPKAVPIKGELPGTLEVQFEQQ